MATKAATGRKLDQQYGEILEQLKALNERLTSLEETVNSFAGVSKPATRKTTTKK